MPKDMMLDTKDIGNGWLESTCHKCGETFIFTVKDGINVYNDSDGNFHPMCSKCYSEGMKARNPKKQQ